MPRQASQRRSTLIVAAAPAIMGLTLVLAPVPATAASSSGHTLRITIEHVSKIGTVLATSSGRILYHFTADPSGKSTCQGACAEVWSALLLPKGDTHVRGPHGLKGLTAIHEAHGKLQVAFHGEALYRYVGDTKKNQAKGQGVEGKWFAVLESGATASSSSASPASTTTSSTATPTTSTAPSTPSSTKTQSTTPTTTATHTTPTTTKAPPPTTAPPTSTIPPPTTTQPPPTTTTTTTGYGY
jgi:predicted lipoprotein with Yx(FWY)xxD motif